mgnify:CR=1 FL=1
MAAPTTTLVPARDLPERVEDKNEDEEEQQKPVTMLRGKTLATAALSQLSDKPISLG